MLNCNLQPVIHDVSSPSSLNTSARDWYNTVVKEDSGGKSLQDLKAPGGAWIDVRDLASAHVLALEKDAAGGERIIVSAGMWHVQWDNYSQIDLPCMLGPHTWQDWSK